jgi:hypothetical protein
MARIGPSLALVAYADAWLSGAKVVVFGDAGSLLPERLLERGARFVSVYDTDPARVAEATQRASLTNVSFAPLEQAGNARDGAFDVGIVEDIGGGGPAATRLLEALAKALGRRGVALVATRNSAVNQALIELPGAQNAAGYYDLHELVRAHFDEVRMLGQTPFVGYAIADFGAETDDDIHIDTALVPGGAEEPEWFIALASQRELVAEAFSVIQLPFTALGRAGRKDEVERTRQSEKRALARVAQLEGELAKREAAQVEQRSKAQSAEVQRLQEQLVERDKWLKGLEARAATADQRADEMQQELERLREDNTAQRSELSRLQGAAGEGTRLKSKLEEDRTSLRQELTTAQKELANARRQHDAELAGARKQHDAELANARKQYDAEHAHKLKAEQELDVLRKRLAEQQAELGSRAAKLAELNQELAQQSEALAQRSEEPDPEVSNLEAQLRERGQEVTRLEHALAETERFGKQLIIELERAKLVGGGPSNADVTRLSQRNAELEANLEATRWAIAQLESSAAAPAHAAAQPGSQAERLAPGAAPGIEQPAQTLAG